jgi:hypothetical protein
MVRRWMCFRAAGSGAWIRNEWSLAFTFEIRLNHFIEAVDRGEVEIPRDAHPNPFLRPEAVRQSGYDAEVP